MSEQPKVHVWITKYALTQGVFEADAEVCVSINPNMISVNEGRWNACYHKPDWHATREAAELRVQGMIEARIKSLRKSLEKAEKLKSRPFDEFLKQRERAG